LGSGRVQTFGLTVQSGLHFPKLMKNKFLISMLLPLSMALAPTIARADLSVSINIAPPALPVYAQPVCPGDGYIWTPGYWAWNGAGYYWVPGTWVAAPRPGYLWTPGWWGWNDGLFVWHVGYWGLHVGFYGGVNYGFGYGGRGYEGGRWDGDHFSYNRSVNNVNVTNIHNTYNTTVVNNVTVNRVSFNGGNGGTQAQPTEQERNFEHESHLTPTADQMHHEETARANPALSAANNHGHPSIAATPRPGAFQDRGVVAARAPGQKPQNGGGQPHANYGGGGNGGGGHQDHPAAATQQQAPHAQPQPHPQQARPAQQHGAPGPRPGGGAPHAEGPRPQPHEGGGEHEHR